VNLHSIRVVVDVTDNVEIGNRVGGLSPTGEFFEKVSDFASINALDVQSFENQAVLDFRRMLGHHTR
jgi:hypothetical protein